MFRMPLVASAVVLSLIGATTGAYAIGLNAHVTRVGTYGDGGMFVFLDQVIPDAQCPMARCDVPPGHPQIKNWMALALAAKASGVLVNLATTGCYTHQGVAFPTMSTNDSSYIMLMPE